MNRPFIFNKNQRSNFIDKFLFQKEKSSRSKKKQVLFVWTSGDYLRCYDTLVFTFILPIFKLFVKSLIKRQ